jgi:predicted DNA-binding protein with PD1-like motif
MIIYALRLQSGHDLQREIARFAAEHRIQTGFILTCVGSLERGAIRYAGQDMTTMLHTRLDIVALSGTLSPEGVHLHVAVSDRDGRTYGGHLQDGSIIDGSAEVVLADAALNWMVRPRS